MLLSPRSFRTKVSGSFYPPSSSGVGGTPDKTRQTFATAHPFVNQTKARSKLPGGRNAKQPARNLLVVSYLMSQLWDLKSLAFQAKTSSRSCSATSVRGTSGAGVLYEQSGQRSSPLCSQRSRAFSRLPNPPPSGRWCFSSCSGKPGKAVDNVVDTHPGNHEGEGTLNEEEAHEDATTRRAGFDRLRDGTRLHGYERCLRARRRGRVPRDHPSGPGSGDQSPRHVRRLRTVNQRGAGRESDSRPA